jgi:hypothetical protein
MPSSDDHFFFEIGRDCVSVCESSFEPGKFPKILHGNSYSRGTSRGSRLHPVKSRVHGVLHGVDIPAREEPREVPRLLARFPCELRNQVVENDLVQASFALNGSYLACCADSIFVL